MLFDHFERVRIVNLAHRKDRRNEMNRQLAKLGLHRDPRVSYFPAITAPDNGPFRQQGSHGAFLSHLALLTEAAEAGHSILILQDDCDFLPELRDYVMPECDIFYGGYAAGDPNNPADSDIIGAHFMGFSPRAAKDAVSYLNGYLLPGFEPDPRAASEPGFDPKFRPPIDGAFVWFRRAHPELKTAFAMLSFQRSSRTDIGDTKWFDRIPVVRELAGLARKAKGQSSGAGYVFR